MESQLPANSYKVLFDPDNLEKWSAYTPMQVMKIMTHELLKEVVNARVYANDETIAQRMDNKLRTQLLARAISNLNDLVEFMQAYTANDR
jgi:hypothetical protein